MADAKEATDREARHGEMIEVKIRFWTDDIPFEPGIWVAHVGAPPSHTLDYADGRGARALLGQ